MKSNNTARRSAAQKGSASAKGSRGQSSSRKTNSSSNGRSTNGRAGSTASRNGASRKAGARTPQESLKKMFEDLLKDTYWAEKHLTKALPRLSKAAESQELKDALNNHLLETEEQIPRLEQVFESCGLRATAKKCEAMEGLVEEGKEILEEHEAGPVRDAALIIGAQKVEHYEIAAYGSLRTLAQVMGENEAAELLQQTLEEESNADELLTQIAMRVNQEAYGASEDEESEEEEDYDEDETDAVEMSEEEEGMEEEEEEEPSRGARR